VLNDVLAALNHHADTRPRATAFVHDSAALDFAALRRRVRGAAAAFGDLPPVVGILAPSSHEWAIADLGFWQTGHTVVPLPHFFSDAQLQHIVANAGIGTILASEDQRQRAARFGPPVRSLIAADAAGDLTPMQGRRIVYTSGSTGTPKGVVLESSQVLATCTALRRAVAIGADDRHLSVLPYSLLLEAVCGIYLPVLAGGTCLLAPEVTAASGIEIATLLGEAAAALRPTTTVLVPQLLQGWVMLASVERVRVPDTLRFVAVGGAAVPEPLADRAWELGIPVHEGYGLTECGSVVAVNVPGRRRTGTVGRPLPGYEISIADDGEILVTSDSVTPGYLGESPVAGAPRRWATGDLGHLDAEGCLSVLGRKDNLLATANGRNVAPEWIETRLLADPRIATAVVLCAADGDLAAILEPSMLGEMWFARAGSDQVVSLAKDLCAGLPGYAVPRRIRALKAGELARTGLLTGNGRPQRRAIAAHHGESLSDPAPTPENSHAFL
jgi:long-subunit acyl-CoA synthetase (AMP-forming)